MWWVKTKSSGEDRGGFQNRDSGRTAFNNDYGPDFGIDYARFSDPPDILRDLKIREVLEHKLKTYEDDLTEFEMKVRNGFVLLRGYVTNLEVKTSLLESIYATEGVKEIINNLHLHDEKPH